MTAHRIFVYGSLRRGEHNHDVWFRDRAMHVADGCIHGAELVNLGQYCCIVPVADLTETVKGEVYDVPADLFQRIETMEVSAGYVRRAVAVRREGGESADLAAEAYFFARPGSIADRPRLKSGDWRQREGRTG